MGNFNESRQHAAKFIFDRLMNYRLQSICEDFTLSATNAPISFIDVASMETLQSMVKELTLIYRNVHRMQLMYCEILSEVNLSQVFL